MAWLQANIKHTLVTTNTRAISKPASNVLSVTSALAWWYIVSYGRIACRFSSSQIYQGTYVEAEPTCVQCTINGESSTRIVNIAYVV